MTLRRERNRGRGRERGRDGDREIEERGIDKRGREEGEIVRTI